jgi:hypothetical protein
MLEQMEQYLRNSHFGDTAILWFAQLMPAGKEEDGAIEYLAVDIGGDRLRLVRLEPTCTYIARYIGTPIDTDC